MLDWRSSENHSFINPRFSTEQSTGLLELLSEPFETFKGHVFLLSSGTTVQSTQDLKWVALSKEAFLSSAAAVNQHLQSDASDVWLHTLPDFHVGGLGIWARSFLSHARIVKLTSWSCDEFVASLRKEQGTLSALVPAQVYDLVQGNRVCPPSLRAVVVGGGALSPALYRKALGLGWPLLPTYGMTETCTQVATASLESLKKINSEDTPVMEILSHLEVGETVDGRLQMRGGSLLTAYIYRDGNRPRVDDPKIDGWFCSQDRGLLNDRSLKILGRTGEFLKIGGESVELGRLRDILDEIRIQLSLKSDVALLPVPDDRLGHVIHLISDGQITDQGASSLMLKFNTSVLAFEKIRKWHRLDILPRTSLGKLITSACFAAIQKMGKGDL